MVGCETGVSCTDHQSNKFVLFDISILVRRQAMRDRCRKRFATAGLCGATGRHLGAASIEMTILDMVQGARVAHGNMWITLRIS